MLQRNLLILLILSLFGCYGAPKQVKPAAWIFNHMPKNASETFQKGWKDGCESGMASMTNAAYKTFYHFKQDPELREDPVYYKAWKDTWDYCRHYIYGIIRQGNQRLNLPTQRTEFLTSFMGAEGILGGSGAMHITGPGDVLMPLENFGSLAGDNTFIPYQSGEGLNWDYTGDNLVNNKGTSFMDWDFENWNF